MFYFRALHRKHNLCLSLKNRVGKGGSAGIQLGSPSHNQRRVLRSFRTSFYCKVFLEASTRFRFALLQGLKVTSQSVYLRDRYQSGVTFELAH